MSWEYTGRERPSFADKPRPGQRSVWDFPRPPAIEPDGRRVMVRYGDIVIAETTSALTVLETASETDSATQNRVLTRALFAM